jgi:hypothetical protein
MTWQSPLVVGPLLIFVACASGSNSGSPAAPGSVKLNQSFTLKVGASESIEGEDAQIGFDSVVSDSRCPKGAQCIVAGDATIRVWLARSSRSRQTRDLKTSPPAATEAVISPYRVTLTSLAPEPMVDGTPRTSDYVATLLVSREP